MLMLTENSTFDILVENIRLRRNSTPLLEDTTVYCGQEKRLGFLIQLQNYTGHEEIYVRNFQMYVDATDHKHDRHLPIPGLTPHLRNVNMNYSILTTIGEEASNKIHMILHRKRRRVYAAKERCCTDKKDFTVMSVEIVIFGKISHVSKLLHSIQYH